MQRPKSSHMGLWIGVVVVVVIVAGIVGAYEAGLILKSPATKGCAPGSVALQGAGSTLVFPLMYFWQTTYKAASVNYNGVGSTAGITAITGHTVDYGASDAPLNPAQRAAAPGLMILPESAGAVVPIYNLGTLAHPVQFTGDVLAKIYAGTITSWNDPALTAINPSITLPNSTIVPVHRSDGSGTTFIFSTFLTASNAQWASTYGHSTSSSTWPAFELASKGNSGVASTVAANSGSIGYVDIAFAFGQGIAPGAVKNPAGNFIVANVTNSASALADANPTLPAPTADWYNFSVVNAPGAGDYPIVSLTYVLIYQDPGKAFGGLYTSLKAQNLVDFLWWAVHTGQQYSRQLFYIPLPSSIVAYDETELSSVQFNGAALSICQTTS